MRESDDAFYGAYLTSGFGRDAPSVQGQAKDEYRACLARNREDVSRLIEMADTGEVTSLAASMSNTQTHEKLCNRYGKERVAQAGLHVVRGFAAPKHSLASPPRLRPGELIELVNAARALHAAAVTPAVAPEQFDQALEMAAQDAAHLVTRAHTSSVYVPAAPRMRLPQRTCPPGNSMAALPMPDSDLI